MSEKIKAAIIGPGNIGLDLMLKLKGSEVIEVVTMVGRDPNSKGLQMARELGYQTSYDGVDAILENKEIKIVFDATSAKAHCTIATVLKENGIIAVDLTPAAVGPYVVPAVNIGAKIDSVNINMVTCGGQATIPIVAAINSVADVSYAEIVATIASKSAGRGTRQSIDEFTITTARGLRVVGGADRSKAIIILNPAEPPIMMRDTIYTEVKNPDEEKITQAVHDMVGRIQQYVPGYHLKAGPLFDGNKVTTLIEVEGAGHYLPKYSGNLDIMTSAAKAVGEKIAEKLCNSLKGEQ
ncbi:MAG: acetaldehyde dehydrogenase (acetylating) [Eubacteriales bacterium]|nr:acetaldehyde dehydrogenase (acetylating) [Eubacteriales bacterium]